jgi:archaellum component FlaC
MLRNEMRLGFSRVDRRLGNIENRVEHLETEVHDVKIDLRSFRNEFERRIAPLEH